jgi:hypothetical protein
MSIHMVKLAYNGILKALSIIFVVHLKIEITIEHYIFIFLKYFIIVQISKFLVLFILKNNYY